MEPEAHVLTLCMTVGGGPILLPLQSSSSSFSVQGWIPQKPHIIGTLGVPYVAEKTKQDISLYSLVPEI